MTQYRVLTSNLCKGPALCGFVQVPREDVLLADLAQEVQSALSAAAKSTNYDAPRRLATVGLNSRLERRLDVFLELRRSVELGDRSLGGIRVQDLVRPAKQSDSSARISSIVSEGRHSPSRGIRQEFEVIEGTAAVLEASEPDFVAVLLLQGNQSVIGASEHGPRGLLALKMWQKEMWV